MSCKYYLSFKIITLTPRWQRQEKDIMRRLPLLTILSIINTIQLLGQLKKFTIEEDLLHLMDLNEGETFKFRNEKLIIEKGVFKKPYK